MKPSSLSILLLLQALAVSPSFAETWVVDGVNTTNITESTRFYDNGKGYYWPSMELGSALHDAYNANGKSYDFLGAWNTSDYISATPGEEFQISQINGLTQDSGTCWYNTSANLITYWQTTYGMFYTGTDPLPMGYNYDKSYLSAFGGTQSLAVGKVFYDNWVNDGASLRQATSWYFAGNTSWPWLKTNAASGGYFAEYFGDSYGEAIVYIGSRAGRNELSGANLSLQSVGAAFAQAFGFADDGVAEEGRLLYLSLQGTDSVGHAITCYGYNTDENGTIKSLIVTNSDDAEYGVFELFLKVEGGDVFLYEDEALTKRWNYADTNWYLDGLAYIDTPEVLRQLRADYVDKDNALVWNGKQSSWSQSYATQTSAEDLPAASTGWDIYAESDTISGHYHAYYDEAREVKFDDHAGTNQNIAISGAVKTAGVQISANSTDYVFTGGASASLSTGHLSKFGDASAEFRGVAITSTGAAEVFGGVLKLTGGTSLSAASMTVESHGSLYMNAATLTAEDGVIVGDKGVLEIAAGGATINADLVLRDGGLIIFDLNSQHQNSAILTLGGTLDIQGLCSFHFDETALANGATYKLIHFTQGWTPGDMLDWISLGSGSLSYADNYLTYTYVMPTELAWDTSASGTWSASAWDGEAAATDSANVTFGRDASVQVQGRVAPGLITVNAAKSVSLLAGEGASIAGIRDVRIGAGASLNTQLALAGRSISLAEGATLSYNLSGSNTITDIDMAAGSRLVLDGGAQHTIGAAYHMAGDIDLLAGNLEIALRESKEISGAITTAEGTTLGFSNSGSSQDITYTLTQGTARVAGNIRVGAADDTHGTVLSTPGGSATSFELEPLGVLQLTGGSAGAALEFTGAVSGTGTLEVAQGSHVNLAVSENKLNVGEGTTLLVKGTTVIGAECAWTVSESNTVVNNNAGTAVSTTLTNKVVVDGGSLAVWLDPTRAADYYTAAAGKSSPLSIESVSLQNGGSFAIHNTFSRSEHRLDAITTRIDNLRVGTGDNKLGLEDPFVMTTTKYVGARFDIDKLSGAGNITMYSDGGCQATNTVFRVNDASGYSGNINVSARHLNEYIVISNLHLTALELSGNSTTTAAVNLTGERSQDMYLQLEDGSRLYDFQYRALLGIAADAGIGGLSGNDGAYLYAGQLGMTKIDSNFEASSDTVTDGSGVSHVVRKSNIDKEVAGLQSIITAAEHTLTVNTRSSNYDFKGIVLDGVSLVKQGSGTQTFSGHVKYFNGSIDVQDGVLEFTAVNDSLQVQNLHLAAGATLRTNATIVAGGEVSITPQNVSSLQQATSLSMGEVVLGGSATIDSNLDLSLATTLYLGSELDLNHHSLSLGGAPLALGLTFGSELPEIGSTFDLLLFTNVEALFHGGVEQGTGTWLAADYFTSDYITETTMMYYDGSNVGLLNAVSVPEPATCTLGLLALAALISRRRCK